MNKVKIGAIHSFTINQNPHIIKGEVLTQSRNLFLCYAKAEDIYYYVSEDAKVQVFSDEKVLAQSTVKNGVCHIDIQLKTGEIFAFHKKPLESVKHLLVFDTYTDQKFMVSRETKKVVPYDLSTDNELRLLLAESN